MIWRLKDLQDRETVQTEINGKWVPARPINWTCRSLRVRVKEAWAVFKGEAEAFKWPEGQ